MQRGRLPRCRPLHTRERVASAGHRGRLNAGLLPAGTVAMSAEMEQHWAVEDVEWDPYQCTVSKRHCTPANRCQIQGCDANLAFGRPYFKRHSVCQAHFKADSVVIAGKPCRFCGQCAQQRCLMCAHVLCYSCACDCSARCPGAPCFRSYLAARAATPAILRSMVAPRIVHL